MPEHYLKHKRDESDRAGYTVVEDSNRLPIFSYLSRRANNIIVRVRGTFNFVRGTVGGMFQFKKRTDTTTYATGENIGLININGDLYVRSNTADIFRIGNSGNIYVTRTIIMEGSTINDFSTSLVVTDPTANRIITFPDATGTVALTSDIPASIVKATSSALGTIKLEDDTEQSVAANSVSATASRTYGIQLNSSEQAVVNVPWTDTNTTYTAGTGLDLGGTEFTVDVSDFMTNGSDNRVVTATGTDAMNAEANFTWDDDDLLVTSSTSGRPQVIFTNTNSNNKAPSLTFVNDKGAAGALNDEAGTILFRSDNASQTIKSYGSVASTVVGSIAGDESGILKINTASSNGSTSNLRNVVTGTGSVSADTVNVDLGYGSSSTTTVAGSLDVTGVVSILGNNYLYLTNAGGHVVRINNNNGTASRTIFFPDGNGTIQLQGENTGQVVHVSIKDFGSYLFYLFNDDSWYSAGSTTLAILGSSTSPSDLSSSNSKYQGRIASYTAPAACTLKKLCFSFYWSSSTVNSADIDFAFSKFTPISDGTSATITMNSITATDNDGSYTENAPYYKTFEFSGGNASLSAGDSFAFHMRTTGGSSSQRVLIYGQATLSVELS